MTRGERIADSLVYFAEHHVVPEGSLAGQKVEILPWERDFFEGAFGEDPDGGPIREAILSVARRNGKTFLIALIVNACLYGPLWKPGAKIASHARSRKQARIIFNYCVRLAELSGFANRIHVRRTEGEITGETREGSAPPEYVAMSAEASTAVGHGLWLAIGDEVGEIRGPNDELCENISTGLGSYEDSLEILISSQAPNANDFLSVRMKAAEEDPTAFVMLCEHPEEMDPGDETGWAMANPSMGHSRSASDIRRQYNRAKQAPSLMARFRNRILNQRISAEAGLFDRATWLSCGADIELEVFRNNPVYGGLDLSQTKDLTALALLAEDPATGDVHTLVRVWTPKDTMAARAAADHAPYPDWYAEGYLSAMEGTVLRADHLAEAAVAELERYDVRRVFFDRWRIETFLSHVGDFTSGRLDSDWRADETAVFHPCGQGYKDFSPAIDALEELVLGGRLRHGNNPVLTAAIANCIVTEDPAGNRKLNKAKASGRIDPAVALAMASKAMIEDSRKESISDSIGLMFAGPENPDLNGL